MRRAVDELVKLKLSSRTKISIRKGVANIQGDSIILTVTCTDGSGNASSAATVEPNFGYANTSGCWLMI